MYYWQNIIIMHNNSVFSIYIKRAIHAFNNICQCCIFIWTVYKFFFTIGVLIGTVQRDFRPPCFFIIRTGLGHWLMGYNSFVFGLDFAEIFKFFRSSAQYHTALSQVPRSIILRWVKFCAISYCAESSDVSVSFLRGQSSLIFDLFFS